MLLIGSRAIDDKMKFYRPCKDWDFIAYRDEIVHWVGINQDKMLWGRVNASKRYYQVKMKTGEFIEILIVDRDQITSSNAILEEYETSPRVVSIGNIECSIAELDTLTGLKWSLLTRPIHWLKTIEDYHWLRQFCDKPDDEIYKLRRKEIEGRNKKSSLDMSNDDFFNKSSTYVKRLYKHDDIHRATCYGERPLFERLKYNLNNALVSKTLFDSLSQVEQLQGVREESYAIALERKIIPSEFTSSSLEAYLYALQRICTTLTTGWFREFAIENYPLLKVPDVDFVTKFKNNIEKVMHVKN